MIIAKHADQVKPFVIVQRTLHFKQPAGTSRGVYTTRQSYYVFISSDGGQYWGVGECAPLPQLSCDDIPDYAEKLEQLTLDFLSMNFKLEDTPEGGNLKEFTLSIPEYFLEYPSMSFGLVTALAHSISSGLKCTLEEILDESVFSREFPAYNWISSSTPFVEKGTGIPINGLVWMGTFEEMRARIEEKLAQGFRCIKLKIGAIDFDRELALLREIRQNYTPEQLELRVDANGAFTPEEASEKLRLLAECQLHSIEQPIRAGQREALAELCRTSPIPIALDEELIGLHSSEEMERLLDTVRPQYIVLKPTLIGGFIGCQQWTEAARKRGIGYWFTSALESNIGLNAIAQLCSYFDSVHMPQGLGTGQLFTDNNPGPLRLEGDMMYFGEKK